MLGFTGNREWVYPMAIKGEVTKWRIIGAVALHAFLFVTPWLRWGGDPLLRFSLAQRKVYALGQVYTAADGVLLMLFALLAAFSLFFFTSLFGRLWCGFTCPQSVFLINWVLPIEKFFEGSRGIRRRRDKGPWTFDKIWRKTGKFSAFFAVALLMSMSFMGFFEDPRLLWTGQGNVYQYAVVGFFTFLWFWDFAWFREQLCNYLCPYARFQSALMDEDSITVTYNTVRGEPRGGKTAKDEGRCIKCNKCVAVCPQGIDIRDGIQLECIACGRCVDACAGVMDKLDHKSLVTFTSQTAMEGKKTKLIRPRTVLYSALLTGVLAGLVGTLAFHDPFEVTVNRASGSLFVVNPDGSVRNTFMVQITNTDNIEKAYVIDVTGLEGADVTTMPVTLDPRETRTVPLAVSLAPDELSGRTMNLDVVVTADDEVVNVPTTFKTNAKSSLTN